MRHKTSDELNYGYISHNKLIYTFYRVVDFIGYRIFGCGKTQNLNLANYPAALDMRDKQEAVEVKLNSRRLLFINLGLIGDLILFRYVINDFLQFNYQVTLLIRDEHKFLFADLKNIEIISVKQYNEKQIFRSMYKIITALKKTFRHYDASLHFRGYLGTGILSTWIAGVSKCRIGYPTSGFGFLLQHKLEWVVGEHESVHLLRLLQLLQPEYKSINLNCYNGHLTNSSELHTKYNLFSQGYVVIQSASQNVAKNIPCHVLKYTVSYLLANFSEKLVFVGIRNELAYLQECLGDDAQKFVHRIVFIYTETFFHVYNLIAQAKMFIGVDSSLAHMSSGLNLPKIIFWHRVNLFSQWCPLGDGFHIVNNNPALEYVKDDIIVRQLKVL